MLDEVAVAGQVGVALVSPPVERASLIFNLRQGADTAFPFWIHIPTISLNLNWIVA